MNTSHMYLNSACPCGLEDGSWYLPSLRQVSLVIESDKYKTAQVEEKVAHREAIVTVRHTLGSQVGGVGRVGRVGGGGASPPSVCPAPFLFLLPLYYFKQSLFVA